MKTKTKIEKPTEVVRDLSAWTRSDMDEDKSWIYRLSEDEIVELESSFIELKKKNIPHSEIAKQDFPLMNLDSKFEALQNEIEDGRGIAVLKGVPIEGKSIDEIEVLYAAISSHIGTSIYQDTKGSLIDHVTDRGLNYDDISVRGYTTNAKLTPHCDSGDIVSLLCVRPAKSGGLNTLSSSITLFNEMFENHEELLEPLYNGYHYNIRGNGPPGEFEDMTAHRVPVYSYYKGKLSCRFNAKAILTSEQIPGVPKLSQLEKDAVNKLAELSMLEKFSYQLMLEPGDLLLLSNYSVFHTREAFVDWEDLDRRRLLLRKWINIPNSRDLTWEFADHYNTGPRQGPYVNEGQ